jgi:predicted dehydrogenase
MIGAGKHAHANIFPTLKLFQQPVTSVCTRPTHTSSSGGWKDLYLNGYVAEIANFFECIHNHVQPSCNAADNVATMRLCETILDRCIHTTSS